ncbi:MAG TPA: hypothetical protein EYH22_01550 [Candidatus Nanopusillus sp.]|nr:hypothetical protein [Candidatus Nanopusillus sp.]
MVVVELDLTLRLIDIFFTVILPVIAKLLYDTFKLYLSMKEELIRHKKDLEVLKEDIQELKQCLYEVKKIIMKDNN